jgi:hypothetical protein
MAPCWIKAPMPGWRQRAARGLVGHQLQRADQTNAPRLTHQRMWLSARSRDWKCGASAFTWETMSRSR